jgi:hypothetical protein
MAPTPTALKIESLKGCRRRKTRWSTSMVKVDGERILGDM